MDVVNQTVAWLTNPANWSGPNGIPVRMGEHIAISAVSLLIALAIALPIGLFLLLLWMKPDYVRLLWTDPTGIRMSVFAIILMLIGAFAIRKIVDIKV